MAEANPCRILLVDDEPDMLNLLVKVLGKKTTFHVDKASSAEQAAEMLTVQPPAVVLTDIKMPGMDGLAFLARVGAVDPTITTILMTGYGTIDMAVQALRDGAYDFIEKPFDNDRIIRTVTRAVERTRLLRENARLQHRLADEAPRYGFVGHCRRLHQTLELLGRIARSSSTVLIRGESGTGKELAARALHAMSERAGRQMVTVNCPALPEQILESELFGYHRGAFTGAERDKTGLFVEADGSTIFLDEIADIPVSVQTKLLRVLQEKEVQPLGQTRTLRVDVRVVASTNQDLEGKIRRGEFREDLFYRLNVMAVVMPSLAEMVEDIPLLARFFLDQYSQEHGRGALDFQPETLQYLVGRHWQGNVRELQNCINRAVLLSDGAIITPADCGDDQLRIVPAPEVDGEVVVAELHRLPYKEAKQQILHRFNASYLAAVLLDAGGNVTRAARACGMERQAFQRLLRRYAIESRSFR